MTTQKNNKRKLMKNKYLVSTSLVGYVLVFTIGSYIWASLRNYNVNDIYLIYGLILFIVGLPLSYAVSRSSKEPIVKVLGTFAVSVVFVIPALILTYLLAWGLSLAVTL